MQRWCKAVLGMSGMNVLIMNLVVTIMNWGGSKSFWNGGWNNQFWKREAGERDQ